MPARCSPPPALCTLLACAALLGVGGPALAGPPQRVAKGSGPIPGAEPGDRVVLVGEAAGLTYTATFLDPHSIVASLGGQLVRVRIADGEVEWRSGAQRTRVVLLTPDGRHLVTGDDDGKVLLRSPVDGQVVRTLPGPPIGWITDIAQSKSGRDIVAVSLDGRMAWWRDGARQPVPWSDVAQAHFAGPGMLPRLDPAPAGPIVRIEGVAFAPDGRLVLAGRGRGGESLAVLDPKTLDTLYLHRGPKSAVHPERFAYGQSLAFSPDGTHLALGYWGGGVEMLTWPTLQTRWADDTADSWVSRIRWRDAKRLWGVSARTLWVWRVEDGHHAALRSSAPNHALDAFDRAPDGEHLVLGPRATGGLILLPPLEGRDWHPPRFSAGAPLAVPQRPPPAIATP